MLGEESARTYKKKQLYCNNCNKLGHEYKSCFMPITSWGIILINVNSDMLKHLGDGGDPINIRTREFSIKPQNSHDLDMISKYMNCIRFLLVRRKHSLGYIEFIRGRYKIDNVDGILYIFKQMTPEEIERIRKSSFEELWRDLWSNDEKKISHMTREFDYAKENFSKLRDNIDVDLPLEFYLNNATPKYTTQEWGFPKGRRTKGESQKDVALREFHEETGISLDSIKIIDEIDVIEENLIGTNGIKYKHMYYVAELKDKCMTDIDDNNEIGDIGFFSYNDAMAIIREYHIEKKELLTSLFMYYIEMLIRK